MSVRGRSPLAAPAPTSHLNGSDNDNGYGENIAAVSPSASYNPNGLSLSRSSSNANAAYSQYTQQLAPQSQSYYPNDDQTLSNTLANSHISDPSALYPASYPEAAPFAAPAPQRPTKFNEEWNASQRGSSIVDGHQPRGDMAATMQRSSSAAGASATGGDTTMTGGGGSGSINVGGPSLSRGNTLKKKSSLHRTGSLKRSSSRRSMKAGSVRSLALQSSADPDEIHSAFYCPVPTTGNPTDVLATRFQSWRKILKDLIAYFREIQTHYEHRSKSLLKLSNVLNNTSMPQGFLRSGGLDDALEILRNYNKQAILEANKAREIEEDVILALTGLRSDLQQKIKEIKSLSGDFKNSVDKEMEATKRAVHALQDVLGQNELDTSSTTGKQDPYILRMAVDRQLERQIDEENYLHQAYLNLETSGRELEAIVVGEIQKSYNAYAGILKRESDAAYTAIDELRVGPIAMPKDHEWSDFVHRDEQFVDPEISIRTPQIIHYPGRDHYSCQEVRAGLLERKSKYLKSYTAGWYVLSPTHLHEFKSADKTQAPVMSLYLPEQKLGSHSSEGGSSNKFILKGRQTGTMHRGHTWVFRAESHDTMMAWYEDIKALTEKSPEELSHFVRGHTRSFSRASARSYSSDGVVDEEDEEPFAVTAAAVQQSPRQDILSRRPEPGGRFPSDLQVNAQRGLQVPLSPSSRASSAAEGGQGVSGDPDRDVIAVAALPGPNSGDFQQSQARQSQLEQFQQHLPPQQPQQTYAEQTTDPAYGYGSTAYTPMNEAPSHAAMLNQEAHQDGVNPYNAEPIQQQQYHQTAIHPANPTTVVADATYRPETSRDIAAAPGAGASGEYTRIQPNNAQQSQQRPQEHHAELDGGAIMATVAGIGYADSITKHRLQQQQKQAHDEALGSSGGAVGQDSLGPATATTTVATTTTFSSTDDESAGGYFGAPASGKQANGYQQPGGGMAGALGRPSTGARTDSVPHIPGEYPRATPTQV